MRRVGNGARQVAGFEPAGYRRSPSLRIDSSWYSQDSNLVPPGFNRVLGPRQLEHRVVAFWRPVEIPRFELGTGRLQTRPAPQRNPQSLRWEDSNPRCLRNRKPRCPLRHTGMRTAGGTRTPILGFETRHAVRCTTAAWYRARESNPVSVIGAPALQAGWSPRTRLGRRDPPEIRTPLPRLRAPDLDRWTSGSWGDANVATWRRRPDSNRQPSDRQSVALTIWSYCASAGDRGVEPRAAGFGDPPEPGSSPS